MRSRDLILGAFAVVGASALGVAAFRTAHVALPAAVRVAISRSLGLEPSGVLIGSVRLRATGLDLEHLTAGQISLRHAELRPGLGALLGGRATGRALVDDLIIEHPPVARLDRIRVAHGELELGATTARVRAHDVVVEARTIHDSFLPVDLRIRDLGAELDRAPKGAPRHMRPTPRRIAFSGMALGPLTELAGGVHVHDDTFEVRAAAPGVRFSLHAADGGGDARIELDRRSFDLVGGALLDRLGLAAARGTVSGTVSAHYETDHAPSAALALDLGAAIIDAPRLAPTPIRLDGLRVRAAGQLAGSGPTIERYEVSLGALALSGSASLTDDDGPTLAVQAELPEAACADLLAAIPIALRPALDGMRVTGSLGGHVALSVPLDAPSELSLDGGLALGCHVDGEPPLADAARLTSEAPLLASARDSAGAPRHFELGPHNPSYRALGRLPAIVVDTFVEAEDGRFYRHEGLDLGQIRRALAHDIETGTPQRGGSTITQQVAKNLFLSGERTLGRKLEEAVLAWRLEQQLGKRRILELYLNLIELGPGVYGVEEGAQHWFHKDVAQLRADEVAKLAALLPAPRRGMDEAFQKRYAQLRARLPGTIARAQP